MAKRGLFGLAVGLVLAQSCTNDFDKFDVAPGGMSSSSAGKTSLAGTSNLAGSTHGGATTLGGATARGGTTAVGGTTVLGNGGASGGVPPEGDAGMAGLSGAAGAPDGCELPVSHDTANCGACQRACSATNVAALDCQSGACSSSCLPGFANCTQTKTPDDGCETPVTTDSANCGGCDNKCPVGFVCKAGQCGCDFKNDCGNGNGVECVDALCQCSSTACRPGERCRDAQGSKTCSCNGGVAGCLANEVCCSAGGCTDVESNPASCGACGRACSVGFICVAGACQCDGVEDCGGEAISIGIGGVNGAGGNAEAGGTGEPPANVACVAGACVCNGNTCVEGQRCLPNGTCG
jgi:hypothetical protein